MTSGHSGGEFAVLHSVRHYWEQLSVNERQQILFLDEPELVKQLYKLNLSLLCVGLMQRHLKSSNRTATDIANNSKKVVATAATMTTSNVAPTTSSTGQERAAARSTTETSSEKTYELLEAMEFMDIGTGANTTRLQHLATFF
ncbi:hypothetical protein DVH05_013877 [Phytophthora capsici]|nr:hypothetical protein DVH05_013877 [Phytophthora capsici]